MNKPVLILILSLNYISFGQNLVPNPSFEEYTECPNSSNYYIDVASNWFMPTNGTSDYFNTCGEPSFGVPENYVGWQHAKTGEGYGGFGFSMYNDGTSHCEYIAVELIEELETNRYYELSFYVSVADSTVESFRPNQYVNKLGAYFSVDSVYQNNSYVLDVDPQFESDPNVWLSDSIGWQKVSGVFQATGGEKFLTIGNFADYDDLQANYLYPDGPYEDKGSYYYIDDVSLRKTKLSIPNVFTPNGDGVHDTFKVPFLPPNTHLTILNRWGDVIFRTNDAGTTFWDGTHKGKAVPEGVYFYTLEANNFTKTGTVQVIR